MNNLIALVFFVMPFLGFGQDADSMRVAVAVDSLIEVSREYTAKNDFENALEVNVIAEKLTIEKFGVESEVYGNACFNHGRLLYLKGDYKEAENWYLKSKDIRERVLGKEHPDYAWSVNNLALLFVAISNYEKAEQFFLEAITIREKALGKEHVDYAASLNGLAHLYRLKGNYEKAEPIFFEAKAIIAKALGIEHSQHIAVMNNLSLLYRDMGNYEKAEQIFLELKSIFEKTQEKSSRNYGTLLNNFGLLYWDMGDYEKAELLFMEAKAIKEKTFGKEHESYAGTLNNLANLFSDMGEYKKAEEYYLETLSIDEKTIGKEHPDHAWSLNNLGILYKDLGDYDKAEPLYIEALKIRENILGKEHPDYAANLHNLGALNYKMGNYKKAEGIYLEAKDIREKALGKEHHDFGQSLNNLAVLYDKIGNYDKARPLLLQALAIQEKTLGKNNHDYAKSLFELSYCCESTYNLSDAEQYLFEANTIEKSLLINASRHLSEREMGSYIANFSEKLNKIYSFAQKTKGASAASYDNALFHKGFLLNISSWIGNMAFGDSTIAEKYARLKGYHRRLANEYTNAVVERDSVAVADLEANVNTLEKELARSVAGFGEAVRQVVWTEVRDKLKVGEAAIEFVHFQFLNPEPTDSNLYAAIVLLPGAAQPQLVPLFEEKQLDSLLLTHTERRADYVNGLYTIAERGLKPKGQPQKSLYELLWQPLEKALSGVQTIYFSPSGLLHRLNLSAIPISDEATLFDRYRLVEMGSTRQLVVNTEQQWASDSGQSAVLFGGVQYEMDSTAIAVANASINADLLASRSRSLDGGALSFSQADTSLRGGTWSYLKWTEKEVAAIEPILKNSGIQYRLASGYAATEESFKAIGTAGQPSPRILHIATHGFFYPDPTPLASKGGAAPNSPSGAGGEPVFKTSEHPMIRSGLLLAGANHAWKTGSPLRPDLEDGILTAYEISQMNLPNTELVVLSACETGLGDIQGSEGVFGLQRAFKIAGAKYLVMSLWQVPDQETSVFMTQFYRHWLEDKMAIPDAFRATQKEMRERFINPYQWAGFALVE